MGHGPLHPQAPPRATQQTMDPPGPTTCVVVPCAAKHLLWLDEAVASVAKQTLRPSRIAVYVTGLGSATPCPSPPSFGVPLRIQCQARPALAGPARNAGAALCGDEEFISFLDADDLMMPYGLARMVQLMTENNATVGLHDYVPQHQPTVVRAHEDIAAFVRQRPMPPLTISTHLGHVTVRRTSLIPQKNVVGTEDSQFVLDLFNRGEKMVHTIEPLTRYMRRKPGRGDGAQRRTSHGPAGQQSPLRRPVAAHSTVTQRSVNGAHRRTTSHGVMHAQRNTSAARSGTRTRPATTMSGAGAGPLSWLSRFTKGRDHAYSRTTRQHEQTT